MLSIFIIHTPSLEKAGLKVSRSKTEVLYTKEMEGNEEKVMFDGSPLPKVQKFKYLGSVVSRDGGCEEDVRYKVGQGWGAWKSVSGVLCDRRMPAKLKGKVYKVMVRTKMLYASETWPLTKAQERKLGVAEMKMLRMCLHKTKHDKIRNEEFRRQLQVTSIEEKVQGQRLRWVGHIERRGEDYCGKVARDFKPTGTRTRGRPNLRWADKVKSDLKELDISLDKALDRNLWKSLTSKPDPKDTGTNRAR